RARRAPRGRQAKTVGTKPAWSLVPWSLVPGRALLAKRGDAFGELRAGPDPVAQLLVERLTRARMLGDGRADLPLHRLHRGRAIGRDGLRGLERPRGEAGGGHETVDEPQARALRRIDQTSREQEIHGVDVPDLLDELDGGAAERVDRPAHLGQAEPRMGRGGPDIGGEEELQ